MRTPFPEIKARGSISGLRISSVDGAAFLDAIDITSLTPDKGLTLHTGSVTQANSKISAATDTAFVDFSAGTNLTDHLGKYLVYKDSVGRQLRGWIKAAGSGETLDSECISSGDAFSGWTLGTGWSVAGGQLLADGSGANASAYKLYANKPPVVTLVKISFDLVSVVSGSMRVQSNTQVFTDYIGTAATHETYKTITTTDSSFYCRSNSLNGVVDNVSLKQVLTPSTTGCTITSTKNGTTYNWEYQDASFNYNDASGYTYQIIDRDLSAFCDGNHSIEIYDDSSKFIKGVPSAIGTGETLDTEIATGTLTAGRLYKITATEADHFGTGLAIGDYFTSAGSETCDANNKVQQVLTPSVAGTSIVSAKGGATQNFSYKNAGFVFNEAAYVCTIRKLRGRHLNLSGTTTGIRFSAVDDTAFLDNLPAGVLPFADGKHYIKIFDSAGKAVEGVLKAAGSGETLGSEAITGWTNGWGDAIYETYNTLTTSGKDITSAIKSSGAKRSMTYSNDLGLSVGALSKWSFIGNYISGTSFTIQTKESNILTAAGSINRGFTTDATFAAYTTFLAVDKILSVFSGTGEVIAFDLVPTLKQVLTPSASGATIVNAISGTTYRFLTKETGFNFNDTGTLSYQIWSE
jgi:hypothetical protein